MLHPEEEARAALQRAQRRNRREAPIAIGLAVVSAGLAVLVPVIYPTLADAAAFGARVGLLVLAGAALHARARLANEFNPEHPAFELAPALARESALLRGAPFWFSLPLAAGGALCLISLSFTARGVALAAAHIGIFAIVAHHNRAQARRIDELRSTLGGRHLHGPAHADMSNRDDG